MREVDIFSDREVGWSGVDVDHREVGTKMLGWWVRERVEGGGAVGGVGSDVDKLVLETF